MSFTVKVKSTVEVDILLTVSAREGDKESAGGVALDIAYMHPQYLEWVDLSGTGITLPKGMSPPESGVNVSWVEEHDPPDGKFDVALSSDLDVFAVLKVEASNKEHADAKAIHLAYEDPSKLTWFGFIDDTPTALPKGVFPNPKTASIKVVDEDDGLGIMEGTSDIDEAAASFPQDATAVDFPDI